MRPSQIRNFIVLAVLAILAIWASSEAADFVIEYNWWKEVGQVNTWVGMLWYSIAPAAAGSVVAFVALWVAHSRGLHFAGILPRDHRVYSRLMPVGLAIAAILFASSSIDYWTVMRFFGSRDSRLPPTPGRIRYFRAVCLFICSICHFTRRPSDSFLCWPFCAPWFFGLRRGAGNWQTAFATAG